jgi:hypothetical protein
MAERRAPAEPPADGCLIKSRGLPLLKYRCLLPTFVGARQLLIEFGKKHLNQGLPDHAATQARAAQRRQRGEARPGAKSKSIHCLLLSHYGPRALRPSRGRE